MQKLHAFNKSYFYATSILIGGWSKLCWVIYDLLNIMFFSLLQKVNKINEKLQLKIQMLIYIYVYVGFPFLYACSFICAFSGSFVSYMDRQKLFLKFEKSPYCFEILFNQTLIKSLGGTKILSFYEVFNSLSLCFVYLVLFYKPFQTFIDVGSETSVNDTVQTNKNDK